MDIGDELDEFSDEFDYSDDNVFDINNEVTNV